MTSTSRTAGCGPACQVVWQGRSLSAAIYADLRFFFVYRDEVSIGGKTVPVQGMAILANDAQADGGVVERHPQ